MTYKGRATLVVGALGLLAAAMFARSTDVVSMPLPEPAIAPSPALADPERIRFVAIGDAGEPNPRVAKVADAIRATCAVRGCDFAVLLGDNRYPEGLLEPVDPGMDAIWAPLDALGMPFYAVLGNHDYGDSNDWERADHEVAWAQGQPRFVLPSRTYHFDAGAARFVALDTTHAFWSGPDAQAGWVDRALGRPDAAWRVALGHHPVRSSGWHGNVGEYEGHPWVPIASGDRLAPLLRERVCGQADLYLAGHDHHLEWIERSDCDTTLIVSGSAAKPREPEDRGNDAAYRTGRAGFVWIELADHGRVAFVSEDGEVLKEGTFEARHRR